MQTRKQRSLQGNTKKRNRPLSFIRREFPYESLMHVFVYIHRHLPFLFLVHERASVPQQQTPRIHFMITFEVSFGRLQDDWRPRGQPRLLKAVPEKREEASERQRNTFADCLLSNCSALSSLNDKSQDRQPFWTSWSSLL